MVEKGCQYFGEAYMDLLGISMVYYVACATKTTTGCLLLDLLFVGKLLSNRHHHPNSRPLGPVSRMISKRAIAGTCPTP